MKKEIKSEIISNEQPVNSAVNHNLTPPRPITTTHFWRMKEYKRRQTQSNINLGDFIG